MNSHIIVIHASYKDHPPSINTYILKFNITSMKNLTENSACKTWNEKKKNILFLQISNFSNPPYNEGIEKVLRHSSFFTKAKDFLMVFVCKVALHSDLTLCTSERVVLRKNGDGSWKLLEEVVLALGHLLHIRLCPFVNS